jgi:hypothetical protein
MLQLLNVVEEEDNASSGLARSVGLVGLDWAELVSFILADSLSYVFLILLFSILHKR